MKIKLLDKRAKIPKYATEGSAGLDLRVMIDKPYYILMPGETKLFGTGLAIHIDDPHFAGFIYPRSGLGVKHGVVLANTVGVLDSDYKLELKIGLFNRSEMPYKIIQGERVAQLVIKSVEQVEFELVDDIGESDRTGFGSTGKQ